MECNCTGLVALVDADNFYVSCERIFNPGLHGLPVVVLSNNDGCIIARSQEVKDLGIKMGTPYFQVQDLLRRQRVRVFSSNYELYGDISARLMQILGKFSARLEVYSIDEAFIELAGADPAKACREIISTCREWLGIPVKIGVASTKTLAKVAAEMVKHERTACRYRIIDDLSASAWVLEKMELDDIWGVGGRTAAKLKRAGIHNPGELAAQPEALLRNKFGVMLARTAAELRGVKCFGLETNPPAQKSMCCSRSFGREITDYEELLESVTAHAAAAAAKLRRRGLNALSVSVFIHTGMHGNAGPGYVNCACIPLALPLNDTRPVISAAAAALKRIFQPGFRYRKSGVLLNDLQPAAFTQGDLFAAPEPRDKALSGALDAINARFGGNALNFGAAGLKNRPWAMCRRHQSPRYTTCWAEIMRVS